MPTATITKRAVDAAKPGKGDYFVWDDTLAGFGLKVTPAGGKTYVFQYRIGGRGHPTRRYTIGKHGPLTPDQARTRAKALGAMVEQGIDPRQSEQDAVAAKDAAQRAAEERSRLDNELAFENVAERWLAEYEEDHRASSVAQARLSMNKYMIPKLRGRPLPHIGKTDLQAVIDAIPAKQKSTRQQVFAYASIIFRWACERGDIDESPVVSMAKPKVSKARDRVLSDDEVVSIWQATDELRAPLRAFYRLLLLTGQRREEVAGLRWADLDRSSATWIIEAGKAKNGVAHIVPLVPAVIAELDRIALARQLKDRINDVDGSRWPKMGPVVSIKGTVPLSGFSKAKIELDAKIAKVREGTAPLTAWRVHDLRRTLATGLQKLGVRFEVTEAVLNHISGAKGGVAGIYQRHDWLDEKRSALEAWARHVEAIVNPAEETNVVPIGTAQRSTG